MYVGTTPSWYNTSNMGSSESENQYELMIVKRTSLTINKCADLHLQSERTFVYGRRVI